MATRNTGKTNLINLMNLDDNAYLKNRLKYHAASRIGIQTGQSLAQAGNTDGHTVRYGQIWTAKDEQFAVNRIVYQSGWDSTMEGSENHCTNYKTTTNGLNANIDLVDVFKTDAQKTDLMDGQTKIGQIWTNSSYPAVKLYYQCEMNPVDGSNGSGSKYQAYELKINNSRIMDWIAPTSVKDNGLPVPGYTARIQAFKNNTWTDLQKCTDGSGAWALAEGNWEFAYISGMCTFHPSNTPTQYSYTKLRITAFAYVGSYLNDTLDSLNTNVSNNMMAIKPFEFNINGMTTAQEYTYRQTNFIANSGLYEKDGDNYVITSDTQAVNDKIYYERVSGQDVKITVSNVQKSTGIHVPYGSKYVMIQSMVFNVFNTSTGISFGDLYYLDSNGLSGNTLVVFEDWDDNYFEGNNNFIAYGFVRGDGKVIPILSTDSTHKLS